MRAASRASSVQTIEERLALQRQDRERARRQEMLLGAAVMIALVRDRGDDAGLAVVPAVARDAGALADRRVRAVGGDQEPRRKCVAVGEHDTVDDNPRVALSKASPTDRRCVQLDAHLPSPSRPAHRAAAGFSIMCANGSPGSTSPSKVRNTGRTASAAGCR